MLDEKMMKTEEMIIVPRLPSNYNQKKKHNSMLKVLKRVNVKKIVFENKVGWTQKPSSFCLWR